MTATPSPHVPHEIVYYEDRSYTEVIDPIDRGLVRRARRMMEMRFMRYNTDVDHVCSIKCRGYEVSTERDLPRLGRSTIFALTKDSQVMPRGWEYIGIGSHEEEDVIKRQPRIQAIDFERSLFMCQISGFVHQCPRTPELRQTTCHNTFEDRSGSSYCCFSGRVIQEVYYAPYDPYTDTTTGAPRPMPSVDKDRKLEHSMQITEQRLVDTRRTTEERTVIYQHREESREIHRINRNLSSAMLRQGESATASTLVPPPSPTKKRAPPPTTMPLDNRPRKKQALVLGEGIKISSDNLRIIRNVISDLVCDPVANRAVGKPRAEYVLQRGVPEDDKYAEYLTTRVAIVYALLTHYKNTTKNSIYGTISLRNVAVTVLYMYARGTNLPDGSVLIPRDVRLHDLLPRVCDLIWYGIDDETRVELLKKNERDTLRKLIRYREGMDYTATPQIRHTFRVFLGGAEALRKLLIETGT